jgi:SAM-dependent methyltransferase
VNGYEFWRSLDAESAPGAILTGFEGPPAAMPPDVPLLELAGTGDAAFDFGCGLGRNTRELAENFAAVVAFDFPNMIGLMPELPGNVIATDSFVEAVQLGPYDVTVASLVFQHIRLDDLAPYLSALREITGQLVILSRTWLDFEGGAVLDALEPYFELEQIQDGDPEHFYATFLPR